MKTASELMFPVHSHAEIQYEKDPNQIVYTEEDVKNLMIEFAKFHVDAALKAAAENATADIPFYENGVPASPSVNKDSILGAYPLDNIK